MKESSIRHQSIVCIDIERRKSRTGGISTMSEIDPFFVSERPKKVGKRSFGAKKASILSHPRIFLSPKKNVLGRQFWLSS